MARAALCVVLCAHGCWPVSSSGYLPWSFPASLSPFLPCSSLSLLPRSVAPSSLRSLPPCPLSFAPSVHSSRHLLPPSLPSSLAPSLPPPSLHPSSSPSLSLPPIIHPSSLLPCHPTCLSACLRHIIQCTPHVVSGQQLHWVYCVAGSSQACQWDNGVVALSAGGSRLPWQRTPTSNPFLTYSKKSDGRNVLQTHINTVDDRTFPTVHAATLGSL